MVFFVERYSKKVQINIGILSEIAVLVFSLGVLLIGGKYITQLTMTQMSPALRISMGYVYSVLPTCGILISLYSILNILDLLKQFKEEV